ncbi:MAG TPA: hypothetical protein VFA54_08790 [Bryobacterales bacterium]|jgi:hypothetical protein|nr:hypothetical protein [Bryobacterales bacterium]
MRFWRFFDCGGRCRFYRRLLGRSGRFGLRRSTDSPASAILKVSSYLLCDFVIERAGMRLLVGDT